LNHKFVDYIPENIKEDLVYVSLDFSTAVHKCCCGCGEEVITPLSPTDWKLTFNGETISLSPSIGNWSYECKSHYFIRNNTIEWAEKWSDEEIEAGRLQDRKAKRSFYRKKVKTITKSPERNIKKKKWHFWDWAFRKKIH